MKKCGLVAEAIIPYFFTDGKGCGKNRPIIFLVPKVRRRENLCLHVA
jgi:hypothetical protein